MKNKNLKFYSKGNFVYAESIDYLIEFNFELSDIDCVEIVIKYKGNIGIAWKNNAKEIKEKTFLKYYNISKKCNPFTPEL